MPGPTEIAEAHPTTRNDVAATSIAAAVTLLAALPFLPSGICFGDAGELQLASTTLGVAHPAGYAGYLTLAHLFTWVSGVDPAYMVSLAGLLSGIVSVVFCVLIQTRLGVHSAVAGAAALLWTAHPRAWSNLVVPEVYMPTLALLAAATYFVVTFDRKGSPFCLGAAALLWSFAAVNRPPVLLTLPFFFGAVWPGMKASWKAKELRRLEPIMIFALALIPLVFSIAYLWLRDRPDTAYNYLEVYNAEHSSLPNTNAGPAAKWHRVKWLMTASQFRGQFGDSPTGVVRKLAWVFQECFQRHPTWMIAGAFLFPLGALGLFSAHRAAFWAICGMAVGNLAFLAAYRIHGAAADMLPLVWTLTVIGAVGVSKLLPRNGSPRRHATSVALLAVIVIWTFVDVAKRNAAGRRADAEAFLSAVDLESLPPGSVVCIHGEMAPPFWYEQLVRKRGRHVRLVYSTTGTWPDVRTLFPNAEVYSTARPDWPGNATWSEKRLLWQSQTPKANE